MKSLLAALFAATALTFAAPEQARAHQDSPAIRVKMNFGSCGTPSYWHGPARRPIHRHSFRYVYEKVWFAPVYGTGIVGYSSCGKAIYGKVLVTAGHYKTAVYKTCGCHHKEFQHYLGDDCGN